MKNIFIGAVIISIFLLPLTLIHSSNTTEIETEEVTPKELKSESKKAIAPFVLKKVPNAGDWLAEHTENGQSLEQFKTCGINIPDSTHKYVYIKPFGKLEEDSIFNLAILEEFIEIYYGLDVIIQKPAGEKVLKKFTSRDNNGIFQIHADEFLNYLYYKMPPNCYCTMAITSVDLYPADSWNFVFGMASLINRVGVTSVARYDDSFFTGDIKDRDRKVIRDRSLKVMTHEIGHMFGMEHCIYYECMMNGSNHQGESDSQPMTLCPVCLSKMQHSTNIDKKARYKKLRTFYKKHNMESDAKLIADILKGDLFKD